jgi:hypothetical protein
MMGSDNVNSGDETARGADAAYSAGAGTNAGAGAAEDVNRSAGVSYVGYGAEDPEAWPEKKRKRSAGRVVWGVAFILAAVAIALNAVGFISIEGLTAGNVFWSIVMVLILILSIPHRFWFGIFFPLAVLFMIFAEPLGLDIRHISLWVCFGVALLLSIGFSILFHKRRRHRWKEKWVYTQEGPFSTYDYAEGGAGAGAEGSAASVAGSVVRVDVNFGNVIRYINSNDLERVEAECNFGSIKLYLDNARPQASGALIVLDVNFGSAELFIPRTWAVTNELKHSLSGVEEKNFPPPNIEKTARVTITGEANFSSVSIIYV